MQEKYKALKNNHNWGLVSLPPIGKLWVENGFFKVKENLNGSVHRYKACLMTKGFHQVFGFDFNETFSPIVKHVTIRIVLAFAITYQQEIFQLGVGNAFLNGLLEEDIFMQQPPGSEHQNKTLVCKLNKALYGLKQALM